jgi:flagellar FliJ protein
MKFKFSYQQLLEHRKRLEDLAQKDFSIAQKDVDVAEADLEKMYQQIDDSRQNASVLQAKGGDQAPSLVLIDHFINNHKLRIEMQRKKIRDLKSIAEEKQQALVNAAKEYKILEKLREKRVIEFKDLLKKRELKFVDDLTTMRFKRGENL